MMIRPFRVILSTLFLLILSYFAEKPAFGIDIPFTLPPKNQLQKLQSASISTTKGTIIVELYPDRAPWHVANFKYRADKKLYDGSSFHIAIPDYIVQGGEAKDGAAYSLPPEFSDEHHTLGTLGMARKVDEINAERRSDGSQFHLLLSDAPHMDGKFTVFGKVVKGLSVLTKLRKGDRIKTVQVFVRE